ncbi:molecular chaperone TorD family protein [Georgenia yuyongxinii]|uniref:Molecular chaperone TorD family protein n=1 Tax=Georgenia yuyongxinii TaxID=2589797 RepID=A0A5B8C418_9MICO|nr:molecular chaperone TorD family protein [Georgenia yuyongxinii]QDC25509.1 molecular chaperone TorD family protein [Georgenia yuyongxinii]
MSATTTPPQTTATPSAADRASAVLTDRQALPAHLDAFAGAFTALAQLLRSAPDEQVLAGLRDPQLLAEWPIEDVDCQRGTALLAESVGAREDVGRIRRDYNRLFFGPEKMKAPPYESVHRSDEHLLFERETMQVRAAYATFGLAAPRLNREPDDHIALELEFVGTLCVRGLDALETGDEAELALVVRGICAFLDEHLLAWAPRCLTQAANASTTFFYQGVAALGLGTLTRARAVFLP